jgi:predicted membrane protein
LTDDIIDSTSIFGGVKKNVISKDFKGGEVTAIFGGTELNLSQADINGKVHLEINQLFGGTKLIIPSNWQVQSDTTSIFGSVEDTRSGSGQYMDPNKVLIIDGSSVFGGISIKSYL